VAEFGVYGVETSPCRVVGRCHAGPLRVGHVFTCFVDRAGVSHPVRLLVARIEAYERALDEIDEGLTARLFLHGDGSLLDDRGALRGAP
jgi:hypothetical protein